ncbi:MAG: glycoside hydrolase [Methylococcaceae bacterium]|nr:glycoside hydrolase [Methylococcaceae bacterium]
MKFPISLSIVLSMVLSGCATDSAKLPETHATTPEQHADKKTYCSDAKTSPSIICSDTVTATFDAKGTLWIVWVDRDRIYLQSSDDKGRHFSELVTVNAEPETIAAHGEYRPKIKLDAQGHIYLTWTQNLQKRHTGHIRFSRSTDGGKSFSKPVTVNDNLEVIGHRFDSLAVGKNGEIFVAWLDARDKEQAKASGREFYGSAVYYAWSDNGGENFHPNKIVAPHSCECCRLGTAIDTDDLPVVLWRHVFDGNIRDHALVKFTDWNTPGAVSRVSGENWKIDACPHHGPALSITDSGVYHAVWFSGAADKQGLFYGYSKDGGLSYSPPYSFGNQGAKHPDVSAAGQRVAIIWSEFDGSNNLVRLIRSDDGGQSWSQPQTVGTTPESADDAFLVNDGQRLYLSWQTGQGYQFKAIDE